MRRYLRCPGAICCPARRALRAVLQPHPVLRRADRRRVEPTALRMRRLSPPAGCGGCSVRGKPGRCLQDRVSTNRGTRVRHHPRPRPTARSRFSSRSGSGPSGRRRRARGARLALHGPAWREGARAWTHQKSQGLTYENREFSAQMNPTPVYRGEGGNE